jgi:hypothetical protein
VRGVEQAVKARLASFPIQSITIDVTTDSFAEAGVTGRDQYDRGRIFVEPHDNPASLDLRVCAGVAVQIHGHDDPRAFEVFERVKEFEPRTVTLVYPDAIVMWNKRDGTSQWEG